MAMHWAPDKKVTKALQDEVKRRPEFLKELQDAVWNNKQRKNKLIFNNKEVLIVEEDISENRIKNRNNWFIKLIKLLFRRKYNGR